MSTNTKTLIFWAVMIAVALVVFGTMRSTGSRMQTLTYSQFMREVDDGAINGARIRGGSTSSVATISMKDGSQVRAILPADYREELSEMQAKGVSIEIAPGDDGWPSVLLNASPFLVLLVCWIFMMGRIQTKGQRGPMVPVG